MTNEFKLEVWKAVPILLKKREVKGTFDKLSMNVVIRLFLWYCQLLYV